MELGFWGAWRATRTGALDTACGFQVGAGEDADQSSLPILAGGIVPHLGALLMAWPPPLNWLPWFLLSAKAEPPLLSSLPSPLALATKLESPFLSQGSV